MKLQTAFIMVLATALLFAIIGAIVGDFRTYYPEAGEVETSWESKYSYVGITQNKFLNISASLEQLGNEEFGWKNIWAGLFVIPQAIIIALLSILLTPVYLGSILTGITADLGAPSFVTASVLPIFVTMIIGAVIFTIIKFWHKSPI